MDKALWLKFWKTFPFLAVFPILLFTLAYRWEMAQLHEGLEQDQHTAVAAAAEAAARRLNGVAAITLMLRDQNELTDYLATDERRLLGRIAHEYQTISRHARAYDQIRYIDAQGMEVVRVNFNDGVPSIVPEAELQDKGDRYYVSDTLAHGDGEVYISPIDLNIEHGEIELPYKPMIRLGTPVFDGQGRKRGVVLVNFLAQTILDVAKRAMVQVPGEAMVLNAAGYWLLSAEPHREWGFMFPDRRDQRLEVVYPEVWAAMQQGPAGHLYTPHGLFTFLASEPLAPQHQPGADDSDGRRSLTHRWYFLAHLPQARLDALRMKIIVTGAVVGTILIMLLAALYQEILIIQHERRSHRAQLERLARVDALTGIANRASFEERLEQEYERAQRWHHEQRFAFLYIDLDGFKAINDRLGHQGGDQVLTDVADTLTRGCRKADAVGRYGGDEFVVLLTDIPDVQTAQAIAEKHRDRIDALSWSGLRVGASIGVAVYPDHARRLRELIRLADEAMYASKMLGKNRVTVAKPIERGNERA